MRFIEVRYWYCFHCLAVTRSIQIFNTVSISYISWHAKANLHNLPTA